jgi:uncharacterized protein with ParB-like and HNH nuclease domain
LPTLYAAEDEDENWAIVDGIQRLTTIARFVAPETIDETALLLQGLEYLGKDFSNKGFGDLTPRLKRRLLETELVIHVIRHGTPELVKDNIFARINTGGLPLSRQELRHALNNGKARIILKEWAAFPEFSRATADSIRDERMTDRELVLRFIAFRLTNYQDYRSNEFDRFLSEAMRNLNRLTDDKLLQLEMEFRSAMDTAFQIFGNDAFRKRYKKEGGRSPINKAVFETISVNLAALDQAELTALVERRSIIEDEFIKLVNDRDFDRSVSQGTGDIAKVKMRFFKIEQMFKDVLKC